MLYKNIIKKGLWGGFKVKGARWSFGVEKALAMSSLRWKRSTVESLHLPPFWNREIYPILSLNLYSRNFLLPAFRAC